ncbi:hypothetical protein BVY02_00700 [bacterium J17]|nr:hypothetical protein BVY02_00700 [bacterium J17]
MEPKIKKICAIFISIATYSMLLSGITHGEIWSCEADGKFVFTNTPAASDKKSCRPKSLSTGSYSIIPAEKFDKFRQAVAVGNSRPKKSAPNSHHSRPMIKSSLAPSSKKVRSTFRFKDERPEEGSASLIGNCLVWGVVKGESKGKVQLRITRGAISVDTANIIIPGDFLEQPWEMNLKGSCRKPSLELVYR